MELSKIVVVALLFVQSLIQGQKVYIPDQNGIKGLSNSWLYPNKQSCIRSIWNYNTINPQNDHPFFSVCQSSNCLLETTSYSVTKIDSVFAEIRFFGNYCNSTDNTYPCSKFIEIKANFYNEQRTQPGTSTEDSVICPGAGMSKGKTDNPNFFEVIQTVEFVNKNNKNKIKYLFDSKDACGAIMNFTVYYYKCPDVTQSLVKFGKYNAPSRSAQEAIHKGKCVENAVNIGGGELLMKCKWDGTVKTSEECVCKEGYEKKETKCSRKFVF